MKKHDFYYDLPNELIAQTPIEPRDASRMMVVNRQTGEIEHKHFYDVVDYLNPGDCLILNDTKVLPARLYGIKDETGAKVEFLLLMQKEKDVWEVITGPGKKAKTGSKFTFNDGILYAEITAVLDNGGPISAAASSSSPMKAISTPSSTKSVKCRFRITSRTSSRTQTVIKRYMLRSSDLPQLLRRVFILRRRFYKR